MSDITFYFLLSLYIDKATSAGYALRPRAKAITRVAKAFKYALLYLLLLSFILSLAP
jgi:hypothetical protein